MLKNTLLVASVCLGALGLSAKGADGYSFQMPDEKIRIVIPDIPQMTMGPHPLSKERRDMRFMGSGPDGITVTILTPTADAGMTPQDCANSSYKSLLSRFSLDPKFVSTHRSADSTFVVLFPYRAGSTMQLKAFILSGYGGTHCIDVHVSKTVLPTSKEAFAEELARWYGGFRDSKIERY